MIFVLKVPKTQDAIALLAGLLTPLAFAPFRLAPLCIVCIVILLFTWRQASPWRASWRGLLFGLGAFGVGVSWVYVSMYTYGNMPVYMAGLAVFLFVLILALFPAIAGFLQARLGQDQHHPLLSILLIPACWTLTEWLRGWIFTGFPWLSLGYSQTGWPLSGFAPVTGVFGITFLIVLSANLILALLKKQTVKKLEFILLILAIWIAGAVFQWADWVEPAGEPVEVAMVQGNVPLLTKWLPEQAQKTVNKYIEASEQHRDKDLVIWPESALPLYADEVPAELWNYLQEHPADFVSGLLERESLASDAPYYNAVVAVTETGLEFYRKTHLVPFGEYFPMKFLFGWLFETFDIPLSDFTPWSNPQLPLNAAGNALGISICYEDAFTHDVRRALPQATLLVNVSEDAWFGRSLAPHQRLQMGQIRALETGRWMLRVSNSGGSAAIDHKGDVIVAAPLFEDNVLTASAQPMQGRTPYVIFGNLPLLIFCVLVLAAVAFSTRRRSLRVAP